MEPIVKKWYDGLNEGKLLGLKCKRCGTVEFPPFPVCNTCSCTDLEWIEISGEGMMDSFAYSPTGIAGIVNEPVEDVWIQLKEGPRWNTWTQDFGKMEEREMLDKLPVPVKLVIRDIDGTVKFPVAKLVKEGE